VGTAQVSISFDTWKDGKVGATRHDVPVVAPRGGLKLETVSPRLRRELIHPHKTATLVDLRFSPDGRQLIAGDDPGGVVMLWDVESGRQLTRIDTGYDDLRLGKPSMWIGQSASTSPWTVAASG
jgi:WD40 repeat protein